MCANDRVEYVATAYLAYHTSQMQWNRIKRKLDDHGSSLILDVSVVLIGEIPVIPVDILFWSEIPGE